MVPLSLIALPLALVPPSVPRSVITPFDQLKASLAALPGVHAVPTTVPALFIPKAQLWVPPRVPRSVTL